MQNTSASGSTRGGRSSVEDPEGVDARDGRPVEDCCSVGVRNYMASLRRKSFMKESHFHLQKIFSIYIIRNIQRNSLKLFVKSDRSSTFF